MDEPYCDLRNCFALAEVSVIVPEVEDADTFELLVCDPHFKAIMLMVADADVHAHQLVRA